MKIMMTFLITILNSGLFASSVDVYCSNAESSIRFDFYNNQRMFIALPHRNKNIEISIYKLVIDTIETVELNYNEEVECSDEEEIPHFVQWRKDFQQKVEIRKQNGQRFPAEFPSLSVDKKVISTFLICTEIGNAEIDSDPKCNE